MAIQFQNKTVDFMKGNSDSRLTLSGFSNDAFTLDDKFANFKKSAYTATHLDMSNIKSAMKDQIISSVMSDMSMETLSVIMSAGGVDMDDLVYRMTHTEEGEKAGYIFTEAMNDVMPFIEAQIEEIGNTIDDVVYTTIVHAWQTIDTLTYQVILDTQEKVWGAASDMLTRTAYWTLAYTYTPAQIRAKLIKDTQNGSSYITENVKFAVTDELDTKLSNIKNDIQNFKDKYSEIAGSVLDIATIGATYWLEGPQYIRKIAKKYEKMAIHEATYWTNFGEQWIFDKVDDYVEIGAQTVGALTASGINFVEEWTIKLLNIESRNCVMKAVNWTKTAIAVSATCVIASLGPVAGKAVAIGIKMAIKQIKYPQV